MAAWKGQSYEGDTTTAALGDTNPNLAAVSVLKLFSKLNVVKHHFWTGNLCCNILIV